MSATKLRLHFPDGRVVVEPLTRTARANGLATVDEARQLVAEWERAGDVRRRPDGGLDVKRTRPRPDVQRIAEARRRLEDAERAVVEHIAPTTVVEHLPPDACPYCRAYPSVPCAHHAGR